MKDVTFSASTFSASQRLVRRLCSSCAKEITPSPDDLAFLGEAVGADAEVIKTSTGCEICRQTGYRGRAGIFELVTVDDAVRSKIHLQASASEINAAALPSGMKTLRDDGIRKVLAGITSIDEVLRVTLRATVS